ncbi:hypothetical protein SAMN04487859_11846 [Roseovarius lutimaris]|uniref:Uncharacterized protein n=1 Tax=Roseovarius lutimaris TaxID=1005928 RepID=A0A1I5F3K7_9RHOB|nr:hypothetical protein SAMN04487859_11846 [Roseovarius lutimaris]
MTALASRQIDPTARTGLEVFAPKRQIRVEDLDPRSDGTLRDEARALRQRLAPCFAPDAANEAARIKEGGATIAVPPSLA